jgi:MFS family permease
MQPGSGVGTIVRVLRNPNFGLYTAGSTISLVGFWSQRVATGWLTWQLTQSGAWLGLVAFADLFPTMLLGPFAGVAADRWDRLRVTRVTQAASLVHAATLFALTATGTITAPLLLVLAALLGIVAAFNQPARLALTPALVPADDLTSAVAITSVVFNLARFLGPAAAGVIIAVAGIPIAYAANAVAILLFLAVLSRIRIASTVIHETKRTGLARDLMEGLRYTARHPGIFVVLMLMVAGNVGGRPLIELLPGFAAEVFRGGATGLAVLTSSAGAGAVLAGVWLSSREDGRGLARILLLSTLAIALSAALFTASERLWTGAAILVVTGFGMASAGIAAQTLIQTSVAPAMRGRALGIYALLFRGGPALGALVMGAAAEYVGLRPPILAGAFAVFLVFLWARFRRKPVLESLGQQ